MLGNMQEKCGRICYYVLLNCCLLRQAGTEWSRRDLVAVNHKDDFRYFWLIRFRRVQTEHDLNTPPSLMLACLHVLGREDDISVIHLMATLHQWRRRVGAKGLKCKQNMKKYTLHI